MGAAGLKRDVVCEAACPDGGVGSTGGLSLDLLQEAARRLGVAALVFTLAPLVGLVVSLLTPSPTPPVAAQLSMGLLVVLSLAMFAVTRLVRCPKRALNLGLGYEVLGALLISFPPYWGDACCQANMDRLTWLPVWILLFPLVVPARPLKNMVFSCLSATVPLVLFLLWSRRTGQALPATSVLVSTFLPNYIVAFAAVLPAWMLYSLSHSVSAARARARELGSYQLVKLLGSGGMGEVWAAEHRMLARPAAIKLVKAELLNGSEHDPHERETVVARFEREARATAALRSPHTIGLYDFGVTEEGTFYYVMELLQGIDLEGLVERAGALPPGRVIHILRQACESLGEAHQAGMIHRDIKPANLFVCKVGVRFDHVKVLDFGLVSLTRRRPSPADVRLTGTGFVVGTPAFMAPEQAEGREDVDARADIYSLGCLAYWLLTGRLVFEQDTPVRMLIDHLKTPPEPPSRKSGRHLPLDLEELVMACLAKDRADRPQDALELADRLEELQEQHPWTQDDARTWWAQHLADVVAPTPMAHEVAPAEVETRLLPTPG